jgi:6-phosphogluconate dehydrogenase
MEIGMIGLGRMGGNMAERLIRGGHRVVGYDRDPDALQAAQQRGMGTASTLEELASKLAAPRAVWAMVPSGAPTEATLSALAQVLERGDLVVDGGNNNYKDTMRRGAELQRAGIQMVDAGVSGGILGLNEGYSLMVGGSEDDVKRVEPIFRTLAPTPELGYGHVGPLGAGHFVKMVHNGVEYGLMEAYAEGFELLEAKERFNLNLPQIAQIWCHGSVIRSRLLEFTVDALREDPALETIQPYVEDSGEGRWAVEESMELSIPLPVISIALQARFRSRQEQPFGFKLLAAMRQQFGGHAVRKA